VTPLALLLAGALTPLFWPASKPANAQTCSLGASCFELASAMSEFDPRQEGRAWNIALAARHLDGIVLQPGETFSFNERVGARGLEEGFRVAPELLNGDRVEGLGGGVCQVASTLYAAALEAGLEIVARQAHSRPSGYLPPGLDATVSFDRGIDLILRNSLDGPVRFGASVSGGTVRVALTAGKEPAVEVRVERSMTESAHGMRVVSRRYYRSEDGSERSEIVAEDLYRER
jgi:vancomycin resistance protein YoaR